MKSFMSYPINNALATRLYEAVFNGVEFVQLEERHLAGASMTISGYAAVPHSMRVPYDQVATAHLVRCHMDANGNFSQRTTMNMGDRPVDQRKTRFNFVIQFLQVAEKESEDDFYTIGEMHGVHGVTTDRYDRPGAVAWQEFPPTEVEIAHNGVNGKDIYFFRVPKSRMAPEADGRLPSGIIVKLGTRPAENGDHRHIANQFDPKNATIKLNEPISFGSAQRDDWGAF